MDANPLKSLGSLPDDILNKLTAPEGTDRVHLHQSCPKAIHLGDSGRKMTGDGTFALKSAGRLVCFVLQAEDTTGLNLSALCGKAALALFAVDSGKPLSIEQAIPPAPPTGMRGRPQTRHQSESVVVDEVHVLFLCEQDEKEWLVNDLRTFFQSLRDSSLHQRVHCLRVTSGDVQAAAQRVQSVINQVCASMQSAEPGVGADSR